MLSSFFSLLKRLPLTRAIIACTLLLLAGVILKRCDKKVKEEVTSEQLKPGEKAAIIFGPDSRSVVAITNNASSRNRERPSLLRGWKPEPQSNDGTVIQRIDGARSVRISVSSSGDVSVTARTRGFCFEPGLGTYTTASNARVFVDAQVVFARRHGINAGLGIGLHRPVAGTAFVAYSYNFWSNTSVLLGVDTKHEALLGVRVKF